jgi:uncharacterized protein YggE
MKYFLSVFFVLLFAFCVAAQEIDKMPVITVSGKAEIQIVPDEVILSLDFTKLNNDVQVAKKLNDESVSKILELTRRFGIAPQDITTTSISVDMKYESIRDPKNRIYDEDGDEIGKKVFKGYEVSKTIIVRLRDISKFEDFFNETLKTGLTEVNSVSFETSKLREVKDKARDMAMKAAKEKATAMAGSIGQTIGKAVKITEGTVSNQYLSNLSANSNVTASRVATVTENLATFSPGTIKVEADVAVSFLLN